MTRVELIKRLTEKQPDLTERGIQIVVAHVLEQMTDTLSKHDRIEIRGFGSFSVSLRPAKIGRNPMTGEKVQIAERHAPRFKAGRQLKIRVNEART